MLEADVQDHNVVEVRGGEPVIRSIGQHEITTDVHARPSLGRDEHQHVGELHSSNHAKLLRAGFQVTATRSLGGSRRRYPYTRKGVFEQALAFARSKTGLGS